MKTNQVKKPKLSYKKLTAALALSLLIAFTFSIGKPFSVSKAATSTELRQKANDLQAQIDAGKAQANALAAQADSLRKTISVLDLQITQVQAQIDLTDVKLAQLQDQLVKTQAELERQKGLLRASMVALYKKQGASTVELLVGSDTFSQFIDQQEYLERLKSSIQTSTEQVISLKTQIEQQQKQQTELKRQQVEQRHSLDLTRSDRAGLLSQTEGDETRYQDLVSSLKQQQLQVNQQLFAQIRLEQGDGNNGGYPYNNWPFSMAPGGCVAGDGPDRWLYCTRQCVSYAAWAVERSGRSAPIGYGNAKDWIGSASAAGVPYDRTPHNGDVAIYTSGGYGHAAYVEAVYGNGTMRISQYNAMLDGRYSEATVSSSRFDLYFVHFP